MNQYTIPLAVADLGIYAAEHPDTVKVGGNTHGVNTFSGVDLTNFTGGVYNEKNLLEGNNLGCFAYQSAALLAPDFLSKKFHSIDLALAQITNAFSNALAPLNCPELQDTRQAPIGAVPWLQEVAERPQWLPRRVLGC